MNQDQLSRIVLKGFKSIRECDLELKELNVLIGANGAGKTTLVKLLARFYDPTEGAILLDGRDLRDYDVAALRVL